MSDDSRQAKLAQIEQTMADLRGLLSGQALEETLKPLLAEQANLRAHLSGQGVITQDSEISAGKRGVAGSSAGGHIITGDSNQVTTIINIYREGAPQVTDEATLRRQIGSYLKWMVERYSTIELRGIKREGQQVVQLNLETIYVPLAARTYRQAQPEEITLDQVLEQGRHLAITGGPGCGKTTVLLHLAYTLSRAIGTDSDTLATEVLGLSGDLPLPILVPLSSYAIYLRDLPKGSSGEARTLATFISDHMIRNQTSFDLPPDFFTQLLRHGRSVILLLDGLDEVPTENERVEVREAIEKLITGRDQMRVVVTCRTAAYKGRTALGKRFQEMQVLPLTEGHIENLVRQAYADIYRHDRQAAQKQGDELLEAISGLETQRRQRYGQETEPLITSPLLVRMLLVVHYSERRLPDQRAELYQKATDVMLLPEYAPEVEVAHLIGSLVGESQSVHRELVQHLAFAMHQRGETQGREIDEDELRRILDHHPSYPHLTNDFISLTKQRGTLLEERLGQYRFLHLAFQEYLTARHLAETVRSESGLNGIADFLENGPLLDSWWREPALLVIGYLSIGTPSMAQKLLRRLAGLDEQAVERANTVPAEVQVAAAELAGAAALEWPTVPNPVKSELTGRLADFFQRPALLTDTPPVLRAAAGNTLARLGDPRPGVTDLAGMELCYVPPGAFMMGDSNDSHQNDKLDYPFWLGRYPVTVAQFKSFVEASGHRSGDPNSLRGLPNHPVVRVSWHDALAFCRWLTTTWQEQGLLPANWQVTLPSEAEWEKAARGGLERPEQSLIKPVAAIESWQPAMGFKSNELPQRVYPWGDKLVVELANYRETRLGTTSPVGCFPQGRSPYGCEEMSGNVWEWTRSHYKNYPYDPADGREDLGAPADVPRVLRGGAFVSSDQGVRCAVRLRSDPVIRYGFYGFRVWCPHFSPTLVSEREASDL